ncbi:protein kinase [Kitasatospora sp. NPDC101183]|uniref:protein kinase domain-containing protein n=1 Tax=Kitasatospora sp. NPDC101183 TaxID=3364100 RepID=UPI00382AD74A
MGESLVPGDPRQLGGFYLDGRLGSGGQGVVYEGYDANGRRVAVKVLRAVDEEDRERLRREITAWRKVEPYCTTRVLDSDLDGAVPYVVSEYVAGPDLRRAVHGSGAYGPEELRRLAVNLAAALVAIHRAGVVHRDLKPENILLGPDGPRVIDFGIARILEGTATTGLPMGTLRYMPPERYRGDPGDGRVDVWGWAAVVLFAATGQDAFDGPSLGAVAHQVATHEPDTSRLEQPLRSLVAASLAKDPRLRPSAEQLLLSLVGRADLAAVVEGAGPAGPPRDAAPSRAEVAEAAFAGLDAQERQAVPSLLLRLVAPGERAEDTLRFAHRAEFGDDLVPAQVVDRVLEVFTRAGVLVWEEDRATLATAALIRAWPRLRDWAAGERAGLAVHQRLAEAARTWTGHGRKRNDLVQGTPLAQAQAWAATGRRHLVLNEAERAFLEACAALSRRRGRLRVGLSALLALLLVVATGAAVVAFQQRNTLASQRDRATSAQVAGEAESLRTSDPQLARRLSVAAAGLADTPESWSALMATDHQSEQDAFRLPPFQDRIAALDDSGRVFAAADDNRVNVWDLHTHTRTGSWTAPATVHEIAVSADGTTAAVLANDGIARLLDLSHGAPALRAETFTVPDPSREWQHHLALSPHGTYLLTEIITKPGAPHTDTLALWNARTAGQLGGVSTPVDSYFLRFASFSADERIVSFREPGENQPFRWASLPDMKPLPVPQTGIVAAEVRGPMVFSPDGNLAAVVGGPDEIDVLNRPEGTVQRLKGRPGILDAPLWFSADGHHLTQAGAIWKVCTTGAMRCDPRTTPLVTSPSTDSDCGPNFAYRFADDDTALVCIGDDHVVRLLGVRAYTRPPEATKAFYAGDRAQTSQDRTTVAVRTDTGFDVWSLTKHVKSFGLTAEGCETSAAFGLSADGHRLAAQCGRRINVWDLAAEGRPQLASLGSAAPPEKSGAVDVALAFSPDGASLAVEESWPDGTEYLTALSYWDLSIQLLLHTSRERTQYLGGHPNILFHPDGRSVFTALGSVAFPSGEAMVKGPADFQPDAVGDDGTLYASPDGVVPYLRSWDARTLLPKDGLHTGTVLHGFVSRSTVSPDGRLFAAVQEVGTGHYQVQVWDTVSRTPLGVALTGPTLEPVAIAFSADGTSLTAMDLEGAFFTYPIAPSLLVHDLCDRAGPLTPEEWKHYIPDIPYRRSCP